MMKKKKKEKGQSNSNSSFGVNVYISPKLDPDESLTDKLANYVQKYVSHLKFKILDHRNQITFDDLLEEAPRRSFDMNVGHIMEAQLTTTSPY